MENAPKADLDIEFISWCRKLRHAADEYIDEKTDDSNASEVRISTLGRDAKSCADSLLVTGNIELAYFQMKQTDFSAYSESS